MYRPLYINRDGLIYSTPAETRREIPRRFGAALMGRMLRVFPNEPYQYGMTEIPFYSMSWRGGVPDHWRKAIAAALFKE